MSVDPERRQVLAAWDFGFDVDASGNGVLDEGRRYRRGACVLMCLRSDEVVTPGVARHILGRKCF